jgi:NAD(P)-dependent dehydrogenase (short-subunit alcohol dehydrogenase family)
MRDPRAAQAFSLEGQLAVVTGGGTGLGYAMTSCLVASGARVVITWNVPLQSWEIASWLSRMT